MKEKKNFKIIIFCIIIAIIICASSAIILNKNKEQNKEEHVIESSQDNEVEQEEIAIQVTGKAVEEKQTEEYKLSNIKMYAKKSQTEIILTIKNISGKETIERDIYIKYLDKNNNEIGKTRIHLPKMEAEKEIKVSTIITKNLKQATDYIIEYKK